MYWECGEFIPSSNEQVCFLTIEIDTIVFLPTERIAVSSVTWWRAVNIIKMHKEDILRTDEDSKELEKKNNELCYDLLLYYGIQEHGQEFVPHVECWLVKLACWIDDTSMELCIIMLL